MVLGKLLRKREVPNKVLMESAGGDTDKNQQAFRDIAGVLTVKGKVISAFCSKREKDEVITVSLNVEVDKEDEKAIKKIVKKYTGLKW